MRKDGSRPGGPGDPGGGDLGGFPEGDPGGGRALKSLGGHGWPSLEVRGVDRPHFLASGNFEKQGNPGKT